MRWTSLAWVLRASMKRRDLLRQEPSVDVGHYPTPNTVAVFPPST